MNRSRTSTAQVDAFGEQMRVAAEKALIVGDWHRAYEAAKAWVGNGGGAPLPDPWLVYAASAVMKGQPRIAVRAIDLALGLWVSAEADRAILRTVRGWTILELLHDPNTAVGDFLAAEVSAPRWLSAAIEAGLERSREEAGVGRKAKHSVKAAPQALSGTPPAGSKGFLVQGTWFDTDYLGFSGAVPSSPSR